MGAHSESNLASSLSADMGFCSQWYIIWVSLTGWRRNHGLPLQANLMFLCGNVSKHLLRDWLNSHGTSDHWWGGVTGQLGEVEVRERLWASIRIWILSWLHRLTELIMPTKGKHTSPATSRPLSDLHGLIFPVPRFLFYLLRAIKCAICSPENSRVLQKSLTRLSS